MSTLIESVGPLDVDGALAIAYDQRGPLADVLAPALEGLHVRGRRAGADAVALLDGWDGQQTADSAPAAFLNAMWRHLVRRTFDDEITDPDHLPDGGDRWVEVMRTILDQPSTLVGRRVDALARWRTATRSCPPPWMTPWPS